MELAGLFTHMRARAGRFFGGLAGQMLALSIAVVIAADVLLLGPSLGAFHDSWLARRVGAAQTAALASEAAGQARVSASLEQELLANARIVAVTLYRADARVLALAADVPPDADIRTVDLRQPRAVAAMVDGVRALAAPRERFVRVLANPTLGGGRFIDVIASEAELQTEITAFAKRAFLETLVVSALVGVILYGALLVFVVRRIRRLTGAIVAFGKRPQDVSVAIPESHGDDELARAGQALTLMGEEVRTALRQRERLAGLGAAVAKIAHDLRNSLAAAQLVSDRLAGSDDPMVRQSAPRLERAIARAAALAEAALRFGKADEPRPVLQTVDVREALEEAAADALARHPSVAWTNGADAFPVRADPDALHRILVNLLRNAAEAQRGRDGAAIAAAARVADGMVLLDIADKGPGISADVRERLFQPFATAQRDSGVGLGLAISRELARAQGGDVTLEAGGPEGSVFRVVLRGA